MTFTLAHLSDPHVGPLLQPRWRELMGKRLTGYWNWKKHRHSIHDMRVLAAIIADVNAQAADHIALTGDLVNLGMRQEFPVAAEHLAALGNGQHVSVVPGNHDAYVGESLSLMLGSFRPHMLPDSGREGFPYLRIRENVALIGLCSAIPTAPFIADGELGLVQSDRLGTMLQHAAKVAEVVVVMIHHPPHQGGARLFRGLRDAERFERILAQNGADLVIHGHNHKQSIAYRKGPNNRRVPIVGVASASAVPGDPLHCAAYHLFRIAPKAGGGTSISLDVRGMRMAHGPVELLATHELTEG